MNKKRIIYGAYFTSVVCVTAISGYGAFTKKAQSCKQELLMENIVALANEGENGRPKVKDIIVTTVPVEGYYYNYHGQLIEYVQSYKEETECLGKGPLECEKKTIYLPGETPDYETKREEL